MAYPIPFLNYESDIPTFNAHYSDSEIVRLTLPNQELIGKLKSKSKVWLDSGIDVYHKWPPRVGRLVSFYHKLDESDSLGDNGFCHDPERKHVNSLVNKVLDQCEVVKPHWISIPQLPYVVGNSRFKINKWLVSAASRWMAEGKSKSRFVLPVILTHSDQYCLAKFRNPLIKVIASNQAASNCRTIWIVDGSLDDQSGSDIMGRRRLPKLVDFHQKLRVILPDDVAIVAGPYWGMNLVLWVRGLADYPAVGLGRGYQYPLAGFPSQPKARVALSSLRRLAVANKDLEGWLRDMVAVIPKNKVIYRELNGLLQHLSRYYDPNVARDQVATFYKNWIDSIEQVPAKGRALALYQDLSAAYVVGKSMPDALPASSGKSRRPEKLVQQLMLNCL